MIITYELLKGRDACRYGVARFRKMYPHGLDISALWSTDTDEVDAMWRKLLAEFPRDIGWAIEVGILPAAICADLSDAWLHVVDVHGAQMTRLRLCRADMRGAILRNVDLRKANLRGANLYEAHLNHANLAKATLSYASLQHSDLRDADLRGADLTGANMDMVYYNENTLWPAGFEPTYDMIFVE